jgi:primosomal protein DnaI
MQRIGEVTKPLAKKMFSEQKREQLLTQLIKHPAVQTFLRAHPHVSRRQLRHSFVHVSQVVMEGENCTRCHSLKSCPNMVQGHAASLQEQDGQLSLAMRACDKLHDHRQQKWREQMIQSHHIAKDILNASFRAIEQSPERQEVLDQAIDFCLRFSEDAPPAKGLYLYGSLGVGKSFIAGAVRQELLQREVDSYMVYVPEFMREIRAAIGSGSVDEKINAVKQATLLILDDIGAEYNTPWTRDEVLGAILQYRIAERLPVIFTSNLNLGELEKHLAYTDKGGYEPMKAQRIMERIRHYVVPIAVKGANRRRQL